MPVMPNSCTPRSAFLSRGFPHDAALKWAAAMVLATIVLGAESRECRAQWQTFQSQSNIVWGTPQPFVAACPSGDSVYVSTTIPSRLRIVVRYSDALGAP